MTNSPTSFDDFMSDLRARLCAKYEASPEIRAEFICGEDYAFFALNEPSARNLVRQWKADHGDAENLTAFNAADAAGRVRILGRAV